MRDEDLDKLFRSSVDELEDIPPQVQNWDSDKTFFKLQDRMNSLKNRRFPGIFDLAAAVVLFCLGLGFILNHFTDEHSFPSMTDIVSFNEETEVKGHQETEVVQSELLAGTNHQKLSSPPHSFNGENFAASLGDNFHKLSTYSLNTISMDNTLAGIQSYITGFKSVTEPSFPTESNGLAANNMNGRNYSFNVESSLLDWVKPAKQGQQDNNNTAPINLALDEPAISRALEAESNAIFQDNQKKINLSFPVGLAYVAHEFAPTISARLALQLPNDQQNNKVVAISVSSYHLLGNRENEGISVDSRFFVEGGFGVQSSDQQKLITGHEIGVGYLLNNDSERFRERAFKVNYTISVKNRVHISPEVIVTDNFSKAYPGIKVTLI